MLICTLKCWTSQSRRWKLSETRTPWLSAGDFSIGGRYLARSCHPGILRDLRAARALFVSLVSATQAEDPDSGPEPAGACR